MSISPKKTAAAQALPLHTFVPPAGHTLPFEIKKLSSAGPLALTGNPHRHTFYEILLIESGSGTHFIDFEPYPIKPSTLFLISPGQVQSWQAKKTINGLVLLFTEDFLRVLNKNTSYLPELTFFHSLEGAPWLPLHGAVGQKIRGLLQQISQEYESSHANRAEVLRSWLHIFLASVQRAHLHENVPDERNAVVRRFKQLVSEKFISERAVPTYAQWVGVSTGHFHELVKRATGRTPQQIIRAELTLEAKRLLAHTELTVAEICYQLAMEDPAYFGRYFKRETGQSPGDFRKQIREKHQNS